MKTIWVHMRSYRDMPPDFDTRYENVWVTPSSDELCDPAMVSKYLNWNIEELELADELGFDGLGLNEHHQNAYGFPVAAKLGDRSAKLALKPSESFRRNVWVGSSAKMHDTRYEHYYGIGVDRVMWGTDYPHREGTWPTTERQVVGSLKGLSGTDLAKVLGLNGVETFDLDLPALNAVAAKIGPRSPWSRLRRLELSASMSGLIADRRVHAVPVNLLQ